MFDSYGRIVCTECMETMKMVNVSERDAEFRCDNPTCGRVARFEFGGGHVPLAPKQDEGG